MPVFVLARVEHCGSRLSAVRWAKVNGVREVLGLGSFNEDDLYEALDWLDTQQERIEDALAQHKLVLELAPYLLSVSPLDCEALDLLLHGRHGLGDQPHFAGRKPRL